MSLIVLFLCIIKKVVKIIQEEINMVYSISILIP